MTSPQENKNYILANLEKYIIDGKGNFISIEKDYSDSDYCIWSNSVKDYKEVKEKVIKEIIRDKKRWKLITNKEVVEDMVETILQEKEKWKLVIVDGREPEFYKYLPTGEEISARMYKMFNFDQVYILNGELGWREHVWKDYDKWGKYRLEWWWWKRKWKKQQRETQTPTPEPTNPEVQPQNLENPTSTPPPQQVKTETQQNAQKEEALNNLQRNEGEMSYEENKEQINQAQKDQATQNPTEYSQNAANKITKKMQEEGISETDLNQDDNQTKTLFTNLKNGQIKDPTKIVAAENQIRQKVWQTKVAKEIQTLTSEVNQVLKTGKIKKENITKLKQKLIEFLTKSNVYYSSQRQKAQALLNKLENYSNANQQNNNPTSSLSSIPWKIIIPLFLIVIILLSVGTMVWRAKRIGRRKKSK